MKPALTAPSNRMRKLLARGMLVTIALLLVLLLLMLSGVFSMLRHEQHGLVSKYSPTPLLSLIMGIFGIVIAVSAYLYWTVPGRFTRAIGIALFFLALFTLFNAPTGLNQSLIITPDYFQNRVDSWYSPANTKVDFDSLLYLSIVEAQNDKSRTHRYDLECCLKPDGRKIYIPVYDMIKKGLPEIYQNAVKRNVNIWDSPDGRPIPSDL